jgi:endonuclease III
MSEPEFLQLRQPPFWSAVATLLLHRCRSSQAGPVLSALAYRWPTPQALAAADVNDVVAEVFPCGIQERRAASILSLASTWGDRPADAIVPLDELRTVFGFGGYDEESYRMIILGELPERPPNDVVLREWYEWKISNS